MKRIYAGILALVLACIGLVAAGTAASAHTPKVTATCSALTVDLKYYNGASGSVVIDGATVASGEITDSFYQEFPLDPLVAHTWSVQVTAFDGAQWNVNKSGTTEPCLPDTSEHKITVCHANEGVKGFTRNEVSKASFYEGHRNHEGDIYPAGSYTKGKNTFSWVTQGDQSLLAYEDCTKPVVVEADAKADIGIIPATCEAPARLEYAAGNATNATFSGTASGTTGPANYTVTATADANHTFGDGAATQVFTGTLAGAIGFQTADSTLPCFNRPTLPEPKVTTEEDVKSVCTQPLDGTVTVTTKIRTVTTPKVWSEAVKDYVDGDKVYGEWVTTVKTEPSDQCDAPTPTPTPTETVTPTPTPSVTTPAPSPSASETPVVSQVTGGPTLAATGSNVLPGIAIALILVMVGAAIVVVVGTRR